MASAITQPQAPHNGRHNPYPTTPHASHINTILGDWRQARLSNAARLRRLERAYRRRQSSSLTPDDGHASASGDPTDTSLRPSPPVRPNAPPPGGRPMRTSAQTHAAPADDDHNSDTDSDTTTHSDDGDEDTDTYRNTRLNAFRTVFPPSQTQQQPRRTTAQQTPRASASYVAGGSSNIHSPISPGQPGRSRRASIANPTVNVNSDAHHYTGYVYPVSPVRRTRPRSSSIRRNRSARHSQDENLFIPDSPFAQHPYSSWPGQSGHVMHFDLPPQPHQPVIPPVIPDIAHNAQAPAPASRPGGIVFPIGCTPPNPSRPPPTPGGWGWTARAPSPPNGSCWPVPHPPTPGHWPPGWPMARPPLAPIRNAPQAYAPQQWYTPWQTTYPPPFAPSLLIHPMLRGGHLVWDVASLPEKSMRITARGVFSSSIPLLGESVTQPAVRALSVQARVAGSSRLLAPPLAIKQDDKDITVSDLLLALHKHFVAPLDPFEVQRCTADPGDVRSMEITRAQRNARWPGHYVKPELAGWVRLDANGDFYHFWAMSVEREWDAEVGGPRLWLWLHNQPPSAYF